MRNDTPMGQLYMEIITKQKEIKTKQKLLYSYNNNSYIILIKNNYKWQCDMYMCRCASNYGSLELEVDSIRG